MLEKLLGKENVFCIEIPEMKRDLTSYLSGFYLNRVVKKKYFSWADTRLLKKKKYAGDLTKKFDLIITFQFFLVPLLKTNGEKIIWWSDATFNNLLNNYPYVTNVSEYSIKGAHSIQQIALACSD